MTALDYLRQLQTSSGQTESARKTIVRELTEIWFPGRPAETISSSAAPLETAERFWRRFFVDPFIARMSPEDAERLAGIEFGLMLTGDANAWAIKTSEGGDLIVLHASLPKAVFAWWQGMSGSVVSGKRNAASEKSSFAALANLFGNPNIPIPDMLRSLSVEEDTAARVRAFADLQFIVAHEFAHVFLGHTGSGTRLVFPDREEAVVMSWRREQEYAADKQALEWLIGTDPLLNLMTPDRWQEISNRSGASNHETIQWSSSNWFHTLLLLQWVELFCGIPSVRSTHPPAAERLAHLAEGFADRLSTDEKARVNNWVRMAEGIVAVRKQFDRGEL